MKRKPIVRPIAVAIGCIVSVSCFAQTTLTNGLAAFWPLDYTDGAMTPDIVGGRNLRLYNMGTTNVVPSNRAGGGSCFNFTQSNGPTVINYISKGLNDLLPVNNLPAYTLNLWVNGDASWQVQDRRFIGETDFEGNNNALWLVSSTGYDATAEFLNRQMENLGQPYSQPHMLWDGTFQVPSLDFYLTFRCPAPNTTSTNMPVLDGQWRMFTITKDINGNYSIFVDGQRDTKQNCNYHDTYGNPSLLPPVPLTNLYYTTNAYPFPFPSEGFVRWRWNFKSTTFGGFWRTNVPTAGLVGLMDDIAVWTRDLSANEVAELFSNGIPSLSVPLRITGNSYAASDPNNGGNPSFTFTWNAATNASFTVQRSSSLTATNWVVLTNGLVSGNFTTVFTDPTPSSSNTFYRVLSP